MHTTMLIHMHTTMLIHMHTTMLIHMHIYIYIREKFKLGLFFDKFPIWVFFNRGFSYVQFGSFFPLSNFIFSPAHTPRAIAANIHWSKLKPECAPRPCCSLWAERGGLGPLGEHLRTCHSFLSPSSWQPQKPQMAPENPFKPPLPAFGS